MVVQDETNEIIESFDYPNINKSKNEKTLEYQFLRNRVL